MKIRALFEMKTFIFGLQPSIPENPRLLRDEDFFLVFTPEIAIKTFAF